MAARQQPAIKLTFLGGVGEIGMNCLAVETAKGIVIIDCGVMFPDNRNLGADLILPDLRYFSANRKRIKAVLVTHGHEDHIGAIPIAFGDLNVPVYAPSFAASLIREKTLEYTSSPAFVVKTAKPGDQLSLIDLEFEFFRVTHSIPDALGLAIRTPLGLIVHSGDFRVDTSPTMGEPFDKEALIRYGDEGVFLLLSDSTNAEVPGHTHGEQIVSDNLLQAISSHPGRVLVSLFSSNVERIGLLAAIADRTHRRLGMVGRSLHSYSRAALESGFAPFDPNSLVDPHYVSDIPNENLLLLIAGSQGESRSALTRVSTGEHADVRIRTDDLIIYSSKVIPGNEKAIQRVSNDLARSGAKVLHEGNANVHTSGHACRDELKKVLEWVRPKHFIPVHGEYRFLLEHARLARETVGAKTLVVDWGEVIEVDKDGPSRVEQLDLEHYFVERPLIGNAEDLKLRERRKLMYNGLVTVHCKLTKRKRGVTVDSDVTLYGVPDPDENLVAAIKDRLRLEFNNRSTGLSEATISEEIRILTRRVVRKAHGHKPLVHVFLEGSISPSQ